MCSQLLVPPEITVVPSILRGIHVDLYMDDTSFLYYDDALQHCRNLGWDLVSIHNEDQYNTANEMCKTQGGGCWIGLRRDSYSDDAWYWTDGTSLDYGFDDDGIAQTGADFWSSGEPNDNGLFGALRNNGEGVWDYFDGTEGNSDSPQFAICDTGITSDTSAVFGSFPIPIPVSVYN